MKTAKRGPQTMRCAQASPLWPEPRPIGGERDELIPEWAVSFEIFAESQHSPPVQKRSRQEGVFV